MLRLWRIVIILALTIPVTLVAGAQGAGLPRYAVAFPYKDGTRIAALETTGKWHFDDLPRAYFNNGDVTIITPVWSPNSPSAYIVVAAPEDGVYRYVYSYDLITHKQSPIVFLNQGR